mmetsp:Transcript_6774/g.14970  ORF Transcript_6774/g.14970 Transcript_6774/m.14970 type:complete len:211 (-) Transcript_6774:1258-1890(-)
MLASEGDSLVRKRFTLHCWLAICCRLWPRWGLDARGGKHDADTLLGDLQLETVPAQHVLHHSQHFASALEERQVLLGFGSAAGQGHVVDAVSCGFLGAVDAALAALGQLLALQQALVHTAALLITAVAHHLGKTTCHNHFRHVLLLLAFLGNGLHVAKGQLTISRGWANLTCSWHLAGVLHLDLNLAPNQALAEELLGISGPGVSGAIAG